MKTQIDIFVNETEKIIEGQIIDGTIEDAINHLSITVLGNAIKKERVMCKWASSAQMEFNENGKLSGLVLKIGKSSNILKMDITVILRNK